LIVERLRQEVDRTRPHRAYDGGDVAVARDEHDRQVTAAGRERLIELEAALPGHPDVEHEAARAGDGRARQEFFAPALGLDAIARAAGQALHAAAHRGIIVDHHDRRGRDHGSVAPVAIMAPSFRPGAPRSGTSPHASRCFWPKSRRRAPARWSGRSTAPCPSRTPSSCRTARTPCPRRRGPAPGRRPPRTPRPRPPPAPPPPP